MTTRPAAAATNAAADAVVDLIDAGASAGTVKIYTGSMPATGDSAATGTLLATITCPDPCFGNASAGVATANAVSDQNASATGTAGWFRVEDSDGTNVYDGDVTATGGGGDMELNTTSLVSGQPVSIDSWTFTASGS